MNGLGVHTFSLQVNEDFRLKILIDDFGFFKRFNKEIPGSPMHMHEYYELFFVTEGSVVVNTLTNKMQVNSEDLCCIAPREMHSTLLPTAGVSCERLSIMFNIESIKRSESKKSQNLFSLNSSVTLIKKNVKIKNIVEYLQKRLNEFSIPYKEYEKSILLFIVADLVFSVCSELCSNTDGKQNVFSHLLVDERRYLINQYISNNYFKEITLEMLSENFFLSKKQIINTIKEMTGMTFRQYIVYLRLTHAEHLLASTELGMAQIAQVVGYESENGFYQAFKKMFADTPASYRRRLQQKSHD